MILGLLSEDLNVAWGVHVRVDSSVGSVCSASSTLGLVALNVSQNKSVHIQRLGLGVGNQVLQQTDDNLGGLNGPTSLSVLELLSLTGSSDTAVESSEGNASLLVNDGVEVLDSLVHLGSSNGGANFEGVLEVNANIRTRGLASYKLEIEIRLSGKETYPWLD